MKHCHRRYALICLREEYQQKFEFQKNHWLARKHTTAYKHKINSIQHALKQFSINRTCKHKKQVAAAAGNMPFHMRSPTLEFCGLFNIAPLFRTTLALMSPVWTNSESLCAHCYLHRFIYSTSYCARHRHICRPYSHTLTCASLASILIHQICLMVELYTIYFTYLHMW